VKPHCGGLGLRVGRCQKLEGVNPRLCLTEDDGAAGGSNTTATTTTTGKPSAAGKAFLPPVKIKPTQTTGQVCVQFDLDLTALSGGVFPGLFSVGLIGNVRYIPATKCWGWTNEVFLQFSLGLEVGGLGFRVSFNFIAQLMVTEQPLDAATDQLQWELPKAMDTSVCHTPDPFVLIERTFSRQWKYILTQVLTRKEMKEYKVHDALKKFDKNNSFAEYNALLRGNGTSKTWRKAAKTLSTISSEAADPLTRALVDRFDIGQVEMNVTYEGKTGV
jgi:hypothetical protein